LVVPLLAGGSFVYLSVCGRLFLSVLGVLKVLKWCKIWLFYFSRRVETLPMFLYLHYSRLLLQNLKGGVRVALSARRSNKTVLLCHVKFLSFMRHTSRIITTPSLPYNISSVVGLIKPTLLLQLNLLIS
jgi:hypothetical protein